MPLSEAGGHRLGSWRARWTPESMCGHTNDYTPRFSCSIVARLSGPRMPVAHPKPSSKPLPSSRIPPFAGTLPRGWRFSRRRAGAVDKAFLQRALAIPVERSGGSGSTRKPTLLEAVRRNDDVRRDLVFAATTDILEVSTTRVRAAAKVARLPLPSGDHWTYFEDPFSRASRLALDKLLGRARAQVCFIGTCNPDGSLKSITGVDATPGSYIGAVRVDSSLVTLFDTRKRIPLKLGGTEAMHLCRLVSAAFRAQPGLWDQVASSPGQTFSPSFLGRLVRLGEKHIKPFTRAG